MEFIPLIYYFDNLMCILLQIATSKLPVIYQNYASSSKLKERILETEKRVFDLKRQQKLSFEIIQQKSKNTSSNRS